MLIHWPIPAQAFGSTGTFYVGSCNLSGPVQNKCAAASWSLPLPYATFYKMDITSTFWWTWLIHTLLREGSGSQSYT